MWAMFNGRVLTGMNYNTTHIDEMAAFHNNSLGLLKKWHRGRIMQVAAGGGVSASRRYSVRSSFNLEAFKDPN
jgi:hypothetical protein